MKRLLVFFLLLNLSIFSSSTDVNRLKNQTKTIDSNIKKNQQNITSAKKQESETLNQINKIEQELKALRENYYEIEEKLQKARLNLQYTESNVIIVNQEIESSNRYFSEVISKYNDYLFTSKNAFFLDGYNMNRYFEIENMKYIFGNVVETLDNINSVKKDVDSTRNKISKEKDEVERLKAELLAKSNQIEKVKLEKDRLVQKLKKDQVAYNNEINRLRKEKAAIEKRISDIIKEQLRIAAEREKLKQKQTGTTSTTTTTASTVTSNAEIIKNVGYMSMPLEGTIVYNFGSQKEAGIVSSAMEIKGRLGQKVTAANAGEVIYAGAIANLGNVVIINHGHNLITTYGNLISIQTSVGAKVKKGQQIGVLGLSSSREPILYFETRVGSKSVDPRIFLK